MNLYLFSAVSLCVAILSICVIWVWTEIPTLALVGLIFSSFMYGFILGEQKGQSYE